MVRESLSPIKEPLHQQHTPVAANVSIKHTAPELNSAGAVATALFSG